MNPEKFERAAGIFGEACHLAGAAQRPFVVNACGVDHELRAEVEALLGGHRHPLPGLEEPLIVFPALEDLDPEDDEDPETIGRYRILARIGAGGMGVVYRARQENPDRDVALKVVRAGHLPAAVRRRLVAESQTLGKMSDPGIAQIIEGGITETRYGSLPFFVMEYVEGTPVTSYVEDASLALPDRLQILIDLCAAVHHAHQRGIIHCDLKPSNILVTASGQVKVLDFGVARSIEKQGKRSTDTSGVALGSPGYMSPEQLQDRPAPLDTSSDVYALGILCYEVLSGRRLFETNAETRTDEALAMRTAPPPSLDLGSPSLTRELDPVVRRALAMTPAERYDSASALADDLRRGLNRERTMADPAHGLRRLGLFVHRETMLASVLAALATVLVLSAIVTGWLAWAQSRAAAEALAANERTEAANTFLRDMFVYAQPAGARGDQVTVRTMLDRTAPRVTAFLAGEPRVEMFVHSLYGEAYFAVGEFDAAGDHLRRALEVGERSDELGPLHADTLSAGSNLGVLLMATGQLDDARELLEHAHPALLGVAGADDERTLLALHNLGELRFVTGRFQEAATYLRQSLSRRVDVLGERHRDTLASRGALGLVLSMQGHFEAAREHLEATLAGMRETLGVDHPYTLITSSNLATLYADLGEYGRALTLAEQELATTRRVMGELHPNTLISVNNVGFFELKLGRLGAAEARFRQALAAYAGAESEPSPESLKICHNLAFVLQRQERYAEAEQYGRAVLDARRDLLPAAHGETMETIHNLTGVLRGSAKHLAAVIEYERALDDLDRVPDRDREHVMGALGWWYEESQKGLTESHSQLVAKHGERSPEARRARATLARLHAVWGDAERAADDG